MNTNRQISNSEGSLAQSVQLSQRRWRSPSIGTKLFVAVMGGALVGLGGISFFFYQILEQQATNQIRDALATEVNSVESKILQVKQATRDIGGTVKSLQSIGTKDPEAYKTFILEFFQRRPQLSMGAYFLQSPFSVVTSQKWFGPYFYADQKASGQIGKRLPVPNDRIILADLFKEDNYPNQNYYKVAATSLKETWTEPYDWYGITMTSFLYPNFNSKGKFIGISGMDVNVTNLSKEIRASVMRDSGYFAVISERGNLLSYPPNPTKATARESYQKLPDFQAVLPNVQQAQSGMMRAKGNFWAYQRLPSTNWLMVAVVPESVVMGPVLGITVAGTLGAGLLLAIVVLLFVQHLNRRLQPILDECNKLAQTDTKTETQLQHQDEIERLSTSFFKLLTQVAANEEQIRQEAAARLLETQERLKLADEARQEGEALSLEVVHILDVVSAVEEGDFTAQAQVSDRATGLVADTLNRLLEKLAQVLAQVLAVAEQVSTNSTALGQLAETVASNAGTQAQEVEQVLQLTQRVGQSAQNSSQVIDRSSRFLEDVRSAVENGQVALASMTQGIEVLKHGTDQIVQRIESLNEFVSLADQFVQEQSQIASLSQVLAMSASMVAVRATEQRDPRQFTVVAKEFEAIASQISTLARQTNEGLFTLQQRTDRIHGVVSTIEAEVQSLGGLVNEFTTGVEQSNQIFNNVRHSTSEVVQAGEGVAQSSEEILHATQSTAQAMHDIAELAKRTAFLTQSSRLQSEQMQQLSRKLLSSIQFFRLPQTMLKQQALQQNMESLSMEEIASSSEIELTTSLPAQI